MVSKLWNLNPKLTSIFKMFSKNGEKDYKNLLFDSSNYSSATHCVVRSHKDLLLIWRRELMICSKLFVTLVVKHSGVDGKQTQTEWILFFAAIGWSRIIFSPKIAMVCVGSVVVSGRSFRVLGFVTPLQSLWFSCQWHRYGSLRHGNESVFCDEDKHVASLFII